MSQENHEYILATMPQENHDYILVAMSQVNHEYIQLAMPKDNHDYILAAMSQENHDYILAAMSQENHDYILVAMSQENHVYILAVMLVARYSRLGGSLEEHLGEKVTYYAESEGGGGETGSLGEELRLHNNPLRTPPMGVCVSGVIQSIGRFIRKAHEREGNLLRGVRRGRGAGGNRGSGGGTTFTQQSSENPTNGCLR